MDIAAKLSEKYTLADVFKQLFHQARVAAAADRGYPIGPILRRPSAITPQAATTALKRAGYAMFRVGRFLKLFPAEEFPFSCRNWPIDW